MGCPDMITESKAIEIAKEYAKKSGYGGISIFMKLRDYRLMGNLFGLFRPLI